MHLLQALRNQALQIRAELENSRLFAHMGDRGSHREAIIRDFLRPFLADCYGLSNGEVFAEDGSQSAQIDIVVYDAIFSTVLFRNGPHQLFPAESVYGAVEVKSHLTAAELDRACTNTRKLKELRREATDMMDFTPLLRFGVGHEFTWDRTPMNPYLGFIFGYRGIPAETACEQLNAYVNSDRASMHLLPDFVFVADPGYMLCRYVQAPAGPAFVLPGSSFSNYGYMNAGADTLPLFFLTLNVCLGGVRLRALNYGQLWLKLVQEIRSEPRS